MKKILITGAGSYIGESFANYIRQNCPDCTADTVDMIGDAWREKDFAGYDSVFHVAGIAHQKETKENAPLYYTVNRDLAVETASKAKAAGVKQFVFLSSMSVYGLETGTITRETAPAPKTHYGISKLQAEEQINALADDGFRVAVLRPPMVYGKNSRGNFQTVVKLAKKLPFFPKVNNRRSMIYIDNLCACVAWLVQTEAAGLFLPQNPEYMNTSQMARYIAKALDKKLRLSGLLGLGVKLLLPFNKTVQKAFGSLIYDRDSAPAWPVPVPENKESVTKSV